MPILIKMQFVYNGKYFEYLKVGRTELLRSLGLPYKEIEEKVITPLLEAELNIINAGSMTTCLRIEAM